MLVLLAIAHSPMAASYGMGELVTAGKWCSTDAAPIKWLALNPSDPLDCVDLIRTDSDCKGSYYNHRGGAGGDNICACLTADLDCTDPANLRTSAQFNLHAIPADWQGTFQMPGSSATKSRQNRPGHASLDWGFSAQYGALTATWEPAGGSTASPGFYIDRLGAYTSCQKLGDPSMNSKSNGACKASSNEDTGASSCTGGQQRTGVTDINLGTHCAVRAGLYFGSFGSTWNVAAGVTCSGGNRANPFSLVVPRYGYDSIPETGVDQCVGAQKIEFSAGGSCGGATLHRGKYASGSRANGIPLTCVTGTASLFGDPHARGAHRDKFSVRGADWGYFNVLSHPNVSLNVQFRPYTFDTPWSRMQVNGSFINNAFWTLRTPETGCELRVHFHARRPREANLTITDPEAWGGGWMGSILGLDRQLFLRENVNGSFAIEGISIALRNKVLTVETPLWRMVAKSMRSYPHVGVHRISVQVSSLYPVCGGHRVAPHGILGQTFDCDGKATNGNYDRYKRLDDGRLVQSRVQGGTVTTQAQGEGALEGTIGDYQLRDWSHTAFAFSRFDGGRMTPRNASALG